MSDVVYEEIRNARRAFGRRGPGDSAVDGILMRKACKRDNEDGSAREWMLGQERHQLVAQEQFGEDWSFDKGPMQGSGPEKGERPYLNEKPRS